MLTLNRINLRVTCFLLALIAMVSVCITPARADLATQFTLKYAQTPTPPAATAPVATVTNTPFGYAAIFDVSTHKYGSVLTYRLGSLSNVLGVQGFNLAAVTFAGANIGGTGTTGATAGAALVYSRAISNEVSGSVGIGYGTATGEKTHAVVFFGISGKLGS